MSTSATMQISENGHKDKVVLITGAARGIGRATADAFLASGAHVISTDISPFPADFDAPRHRTLQHDISNEGDWQKVVASIMETEGRLDYLVNNAGVSLGGPMTKLDLDDWRWVMSVNIDGTFLGLKYGLDRVATGGAIVNISSALAVTSRRYTGAIAASKAAILSMTRTAALETSLSGRTIRVNAVLPGGVDTPIFDDHTWWPGTKERKNSPEAARKDIVTETPMQRLGNPDEIASTVLFLCSDAASFMTGAALTVDGGYTSS